MSKIKNMSKKKKAVLISVCVVIIIIAIIAASILSGMRNVRSTVASVNETAEVVTGDIDTTVSGTGNIEMYKTKNVTVPSGITVTKVNVESGDYVKKGDTLATLDTTSIASAIVDAQDALESVEDSLDEDDLSTYEKTALKGEKSDLNDIISELKELLDNPKITATCEGVIESVNVSENSSTSSSSVSLSSDTSSSTDTSSQLSSLITGTSANSSSVNVISLSSSEEAETTVSSDETTTADSTEITTQTDENTTSASDSTTAYSGSQGTTKKSSSNSTVTQPSASSSASISDYASSSNSASSYDASAYTQSSASTSSDLSSVTSSATASYDTSKVTVFVICAQDKVRISISVDELDILDIEEGQSAVVTIDALGDEEFSGQISDISYSAELTSGSSKYSVNISVDKDERMKDGMSASVVIVTSTAENVNTIPVDALQEENGESFVYTSQDDEGNLGGKTVVETGISNSTTVEITSGLSTGDVVYYASTNSDSGGMFSVMENVMQGNDSESGESDD